MTDRKKVIRNLETVYQWVTVDVKFSNGLTGNDYEKIAGWVSDGIAMLKEQEPVKPKYNARTNWFECGVCHYSMTSGMNCRSELIPAFKVRFCAKCGKAVKWDA